MITVLLFHILVIQFLQLHAYASSDDSTSSEYEEEESSDSASLDGIDADIDDANRYWDKALPTIQINQKGDRLQFSTLPLPFEYKIDTTLQIITSSELAKQLVLEDKNRKFHRIPLKESLDIYGNMDSTTKHNHYQIQLAQPGDFCFVKLPSDRTGITSSENTYCFRVQTHHSLLAKPRVIYIENATDYTNNMKALKAIIEEKLHIASEDISSDGSSDDSDSSDDSSNDSSDGQQTPHSGTTQTSASDNDDADLFGPFPGQIKKSVIHVPPKHEEQEHAEQQEEEEEKEEKKEAEEEKEEEEKKEEEEEEKEEEKKEADLERSSHGVPYRRMIGSKHDVQHHPPTIIGINVAFETHGILINELEWEKLLFLIQHIVDKLLPFLSSNDVIITLPVSNKLKHYKRATVSERVALIVHKARKKRKQLNEVYELQYSTNSGSTFGGKIILKLRPTDPQKDLDVPAQELHNLADFVISMGSLPHNTDIMGISVRSPQNNHVCFSQIIKFGYDNMYNIANKIAKCTLNAMKIDTNNLNIYITNDGDNIDLSSDDDAKHNAVVEFELNLQDDECCLIEISQQSMYHKLYKDDGVYKNRQIILLKANTVTVIESSDLLSSKTKHIQDIVFYVDIVGGYQQYENEYGLDLSSHSKMESLHYLLYSSKEYVSIPYGLWYLCVSWTQSIKGINKITQITKCSDDLYFNVHFLLTQQNLKVLTGDIMDNSGFLTLQLVHLQSLYKTISDMRNELNEQSEDERDLYHNLLLHQIASSSDEKHLKQMEEMYQNELNQNGENQVKRKDLKNQLKVLKQRLQNDEEFEEQYDKKLEMFAKTDINDPLKNQNELMNQIIGSQQQIVRLRLEIRQKEQILESLQQQIDSIDVHTT